MARPRSTNRDKNLNSVAVVKEDNEILDRLYGAILLPPADEVISAILLASFVFKFTVGAVIRSVRANGKRQREESLKEGLIRTRAEFKQKQADFLARQKETREQSRDTSLTTENEAIEELSKDDGTLMGPLANQVLSLALKEANSEDFIFNRPEPMTTSISDAIGARLQEVHAMGFDHLTQDVVFMRLKLRDLPEASQKAVLVLIESGLTSEHVKTGDRGIQLSPRGAATAAAIRAIVINENGLSPDTSFAFLNQRASENVPPLDGQTALKISRASETVQTFGVNAYTNFLAKEPTLVPDTPSVADSTLGRSLT